MSMPTRNSSGSRNPRMKKIIIGSSLLVILAAGGFSGVKQYKSWRQASLVKQARQCLASADYRNASLCARQVVESNPSNVEAARVLADLAELGRTTNAIFWRERVVELEPHNPDNRLMLARTALMLSSLAVAHQALEQVDAATRQTADYHKLQANLNWSSARLPEAERHFAEASRLEPTNLVSRMNLNRVRLASTNSAIAAGARAALQALATNDSISADVLRHLTTDAVDRRKLDEATGYSQSLLGTGAGLRDQLRHLGLLRETRAPDFDAYLSTLQNQYRTNAALAAMLGRWMIAADMTAQGVAWAKALPEAVRDQRPITAMLAEGLLAASDWKELAKHLESRAWDDEEYFRQLLLARLAREQRNISGARNHWLKSLKAASGNTEWLIQLARTTESWGWRDEMDEALGAIVARFPEQKWAEEYLGASLHLGGKTQALQNLFARTMEREPTNNLAKSNFATLGMLFDPTDKRLHRLAEEAFQAQGTNAFVASTYALSLHFQRHTAQALQVMERLPAERLETPAIAIWYGYLLTEAGQRQRAQRYLQLAEKARLLPEEKRLLAKARGEG
jgi:predicted Zn-dependent protease